MHEPTGLGKLVKAVLLSLINEACVNVCCTTLLSSELVGPTCVQTGSSNPRGRACRPSGKGSGRRGYSVTLYLFYLVSCQFLDRQFLDRQILDWVRVRVRVAVQELSGSRFIYTARLLVSCFSRCLIQACMPAGLPTTQHTSHHRPRPNLAVRADRAYRQPSNMQPGTFCYR